MDALLIGFGIVGILLAWFGILSNDGLTVKQAGKVFVVAITMIVVGSWLDDWTEQKTLIEHHNVSSLPADGGQLEFFDPVDVLETHYEYPWYIAENAHSEFEVAK